MRSEDIFLSLIIPVYNEEIRLDKPLVHVAEYLQANFPHWEILYVDDGSTDNTYQKLQMIQRTQNHVRAVHYANNRGKGHAVREGLRSAEGNILLFSDADFSAPIEEMQKLLAFIVGGYDVAIGSRGLPDSNVEVHQSWARETMGKMGNLLIRALLPIDLSDTQCGFKMFRKEAVVKILPKLKINGFAFDIEILAIAQVIGLRIAEVPVTWRNVPESKVHTIHSLHVLQDLLTIRYRLAMGEYTQTKD